MIKFEDYNKTLNNLIKNVGKTDLDIVKVLKDLIKDILATQLSKFSFVKGLDFEKVADELSIDIYLQIKSGKLKHVKYWSAYLKRYLRNQIISKFVDPRQRRLDEKLVRVKHSDDALKEFYKRAFSDILKAIEMIKMVFPHISEIEMKALLIFAKDGMFVFFDRVSCFDQKKKTALKTLLKVIRYYTRKEVVRLSKRKTSSEVLLRALAGIMISPLFLVLNVEDMAKVISTLGGQTIRIPTLRELRSIIPVLLIFYDNKIKGLSADKISKKYKLTKKETQIILEIIESFELSEVERKNLIFVLTKLVEMVNAQSDFISKRLSEIEEKVIKNADAISEIYKTLLKEEEKVFKDVMKLVNEVVKYAKTK